MILSTDLAIPELASLLTTMASSGARQIAAIAAPPGAGKSTLAKALVKALNHEGAAAVLMPMDGFHLDNAVLQSRDLLQFKGAPETFDAAGCVATLQRIQRDDLAEVVIPRFDPRRDLAVAGAAVVAPEHRIVVCEGNYLLMSQPPWGDLGSVWDLTVWIEVADAELRRRLVQRWLDHGMDPAAAEARAEGNDMRNARTVREKSRRADIVVAGD